MLLALVGVTGVGKSYYKEKIVTRLNFKKVNTIRTREIRKGEINGVSGLFMTKEEVNEIDKQGKIAYKFDVFGGEYAYLKDEIFSKDNMVFEMHYTSIDDWKKVRPNIKTIYILPNDIEKAKEETRQRNLPKEKEENRLQEIQEQYDNVINNKDLQQKFDYIFVNNYDKDSEEKLMDLVKKIAKNEEG